MSDYAAYWECDPADAPALTGAATVMDCTDIRDVLDHLGIDLHDLYVFDVGCGTGRLAQLARPARYAGCDISDGMVASAKSKGLTAFVISAPDDLRWTRGFDLIACLSVFTHIPRDERQAYLAAFQRIAPELLVDILPGDGHGSIAHWTAHPGDFRHDLDRAGWNVQGEYGRTAPDGTTHLYFHCDRDVPPAGTPAPVDARVSPLPDPAA